MIIEENDVVPVAAIEPAPKKRRVDSDEFSGASMSVYYDNLDSDSRLVMMILFI